MRRILLPVFALSLLASSLQAQPRISRDLSAAPPPELRAVFSADPQLKEAVESRPLFFTPPADQLADAQTLEFRIVLNGKPYLEETLRLKRGGVGAFELLATQPALLDRLYQLATNRANKLNLQVFVDGRAVHEFSSFQDLVRYNRELKIKGFNPLPAPSRVVDHTGSSETAAISPARPMTAKGMQPDPWCADQCYADYDRCYDGGWGCDYGDCSRCQNNLDACLYYCPIVCVDPKSVKDTTSTSLVGVNPGFQECREHWWENDFYLGEWYTDTLRTFKHTTTRRTEYCDGRVEQQVISVSYTYQRCWSRTYLQCNYPWTWAQPSC